MSITADLRAARMAAGEAYMAAAEAYAEAWAQLAALDRVPAIRDGNTSGFGQPFYVAGHAEFLRDTAPTSYGRACDRSTELLQAHMRSLPGG